MQQFLQFIILTFTFIYVYLRVRVGYARPEHEQQHGYHHDTKVKPEAATAVVELLVMGTRKPDTC